MSTVLKVIFLDAAGTLITPVESVGATYARIAAEHGVTVSGEALNQAFRAVWRGTPSPLHPEGCPPVDDDRSWWRQVASGTFTQALGRPLDDAVMEPLFNRLYAHYAQASAWRLYDEVRPALEALAGRFRLIVLSNFDRRLLSIFDGHGLMPLVEKIILSSEVGASKPHPRMFQAALQAAGVPASECLHVGDDPKCDVEGAELAGLRFFAVQRPENGLDALVRLLDLG
ncbi:MAG: HAD-IA family hydrolase [Prosthecobacter sp.]